MPILEGALDRSVELAAAMDSRGYGRTGHVPQLQRRITGALVLLGLLGIALGVYALLTDAMASRSPRSVRSPVGLLVSFAGLLAGHRRVAPEPLPAGSVGVARVAGHCVRSGGRRADCRSRLTPASRAWCCRVR